MSYVSPSSTTYATSTVMRAVSHYFENRRIRRARQRSVNALNGLDAMTLKDISIKRSEIQSVVFDI
ncbi:MAG: DUF1127 domain-containing protein [Rhizobiaceae bacterium]